MRLNCQIKVLLWIHIQKYEYEGHGRPVWCKPEFCNKEEDGLLCDKARLLFAFYRPVVQIKNAEQFLCFNFRSVLWHLASCKLIFQSMEPRTMDAHICADFLKLYCI